jgi:HrpA-like RNA helicase
VFPLYTKGQYLGLAEDTPPGSTRENLESLVMTAKMGGIDDVVGFPWPAAFEPHDDPNSISLLSRLARSSVGSWCELIAALRAGGAVDHDGHPTSFGKELTRFQGLGSTSSALAILYADRLALCSGGCHHPRSAGGQAG